MSVAFALIWGIALVLAGVVLCKKGVSGLSLAGASAFGTFKSLAIRLPCALLITSFMFQILPLHLVSDLMGSESGMTGILLASVAGIALPGGHRSTGCAHRPDHPAGDVLHRFQHVARGPG